MRMLLITITLAILSGAQAVMAYEEPEYEVLLSAADYEVRRYAPYIVAEVDVEGGMGKSGNEGFRILAGYIFGDNEPGEKMSMTVPVESRPTREELDRHTYAFVMERRYTLATLPSPVDPRIRLVTRPQRVMAVRRYSGRWTEANYDKQQQALFAALDRDGIKRLGNPLLARYNGPFTPWFMRRNEVLVEIEAP